MNTEVIVIGTVVIVFGFIIYKSFFTKKVIPPSTGVGGSGIENSDNSDEGAQTEIKHSAPRGIMKIIYSDKILDRLSILMNIGGITLYPYIILRERHNVQPQSKSTLKLINHESIHIEQQKELLVIIFYLWYVIEWFIRLFMKGSAYSNISFEREANTNENNLDYIKNRKWYSFIKYL